MMEKVCIVGKFLNPMVITILLLSIPGKIIRIKTKHCIHASVYPSPKKGPSRPFNFFGYLTTNTMNRLASKILSKSYNHTFLVNIISTNKLIDTDFSLQFSHYPTTTMLTGKSTEGYTFRDLANHFSIYFCGHLHRLTAGLGDVLKSYSKNTDSLELELSDMKDHGSYRIVAVDHDLISFVDIDLPIDQIPPALAEGTVPLTEANKVVWPKKIKPAPVILITNPKDSRFTLPSKEPLQNIRKSSHIRFLVFTEYEPTELRVKVFMDDKHHPFPAKFVGSMKDNMPLWTTLWEPNDFDDFNTHILRIEVTSPDGQTGVSQVPFRMDNMRMKIQGGVGEWVIWSNMAKLVSVRMKKKRPLKINITCQNTDSIPFYFCHHCYAYNFNCP